MTNLRSALLIISLLFPIIDSTSSPPSPPTGVQHLINNPYLDPEVFRTFTEDDNMKFFVDDSPTNSDQSTPQITDAASLSSPTKKGSKRKYNSVEERKQAKLMHDRLSRRQRRAMIRTLSKEHELQQHKRVKHTKYNREARERIRNLPDNDQRKQNHRLTIRNANQRFRQKKILENPDYFAEYQREQKEKKRQSVNGKQGD